MNIYFAGSITGGREHAAIYPSIIELLQQYGRVLTEHVGSQALDGAGETKLEAQAIFQRDVDWVDASDLVVAEVTTPSLGVGYELGRAESKGIPVIALFDTRSSRKLSAMVSGNEHNHCIRYSSQDELIRALQHALSSVEGSA